jgi:hypothetical protein
MTKKIAIIGKGTSGSQAIIHFLRYMPECELEWHFDPNISTQTVGEGSTLELPRNLFNSLNFNYFDLNKLNATIKTGIYKSGWGNNRCDFFHQFPAPQTALHFNAVSLQNFIFEKVKNKISIFEHNIKSEDIDSDFILDCSGKPSSYDDFHIAKYIPVNSSYITQCYWEYPRFNYTLTIARPYGWVFGIPLQNRCSIGYLYNENINSLEEVQEDVKKVFDEYHLIPSETSNNLKFKNYFRKINFNERISYSGNSSFFLEPLEATSISTMDSIQRKCYDIWNGNMSIEEANFKIKEQLVQIETMIMLHYFAGSKYKTEFWEFAQKNGEKCIEESLFFDQKFKTIIDYTLQSVSSNFCERETEYGSWWLGSFFDNINGLGIREKLIKTMNHKKFVF